MKLHFLGIILVGLLAGCQQGSPAPALGNARVLELAHFNQLRSGERGLELDRSAPAAKAPYTIYLMNLSPRWTCVAISFDREHWSPTPAVGQTCASPCTDENLRHGFKDRNFTPIATSQCGSKVRVWLKFQNAAGEIGALKNPYEFFADCRSDGQVLPYCD